MEVQSDFELVTFDFVSNPSTHGAFMRPVAESISESVVSHKKNSDVDNLLRDILCEMSGVCCI
jgi:hypothetical protein